MMKEHMNAPSARGDHSTPTSTAHKQSNPESGVFAGLIPKIRRAIEAKGYERPTPIQEQCIPPLLAGSDLLGQAQTGTGKTAAFTLPMLQRLSEKTGERRRGTPRALILAPTRELAAQIGESVREYGRFLRLKHTVVFGGVNQFHQVKALNRGIDVLVATPGRLLDLIGQGHIHLNSVEIFVLDEVDRMLDMGFIPDVKRINELIPKNRQAAFFSATMPPKMVELASELVRDPARVTIKPDKPAVENIEQKMLFVNKKNKDALLVSLLENSNAHKVLIFTQMKHVANRVMKKLQQAGVDSTAIHGNKSQAARTRALDGFKHGRYRALVATDVAARGLDVDDITHVINYDLPIEAETYVHRIGRTARAGADGDAISFCTTGDGSNLRAIERLLGKPVPTELEHAFHCDEAYQSRQTPGKKPFFNQGGKKRRWNDKSNNRKNRSHHHKRRRSPVDK